MYASLIGGGLVPEWYANLELQWHECSKQLVNSKVFLCRARLLSTYEGVNLCTCILNVFYFRRARGEGGGGQLYMT